MADYYQPSQVGASPVGPQSQDDTNTTVPVIQQNTPFTKVANNVNVQNSGGGSSGGGGGIGSFLGPIGSIIGALFAEGGVVGDKANGFAGGGQVDNGKNSALATGYLVGALHQKKYGGNPKTLPDAANEIKAMLSGGSSQQAGPQGLASGGMPNNDTSAADQQLAMQALMKALGVDNAASTQQQNSNQQTTQASQIQPAQQQAPANVANGAPQGPQSFGNSEAQVGGAPNPQRGYAMGGMPSSQPMMQSKGYAAGGADMMPPQGPPQGPPGQDPNAQPPLQAGQQFQGDGSVKGPGGPQDDAIPAKLSNGEYVIAAPAVQFFGVDKLDKLNEQGKQGFAQSIGQVQQNQQQSPQGQPSTQPQGQSPTQAQAPPPMMQAKGGTVMRAKGSGYCGL